MAAKKYKKNYKKKLGRYMRVFYQKYPFLRRYLRLVVKEDFFFKTRFSGWGMMTEHELPWTDDYIGEIFRKAAEDIKKKFRLNVCNVHSGNIDELLWRHWNVSTAIRYAINFSNTNEYNFVECGVGPGVSTFFALREISGQQKIKKFTMHLYDAWNVMREEQLLESELDGIGEYKDLDINITRENLSEFREDLVFHQGYIPESFKSSPAAPNSILYLHIDLNSAKATLNALEFFFPHLVGGAVILFDDYGWIGYKDTKKIVDEFFHNKTGILMKFPTGQALYLHR